MIVDPQHVEKIRQVRAQTEMSLKPSPFLKETYSNDSGETLPVRLRNYQKSGVMNLLMSPRMVLGDDTGLGKAQPVHARVLTPNGWTHIGDLKIGDDVVGSNGLPTKVVGVYPQGFKRVFRVTMSDDSSTLCCDEHLWTVRTGSTWRFGDGWCTFTLKHIMKVGLKHQRNLIGLRWEIPTVKPIEFQAKKLPVDPYLLGVLLGSGSSRIVSACNSDPFLFELVNRRLPDDCKFVGELADFSLPTNFGARDSLTRGLAQLGLMRKNWTDEFIPEAYLHASIGQRTHLLHGLMDVGGFISKDGKITQFHSSNKTLICDFVYLIRSLGGTANVASKRAKKDCLAYAVTVSLPNDIVPFSLPQKAARWTPRTKHFSSRRIAKIEPACEAECVCIRVEAKDQLYVTDDFIVTHNTLEVLSAIGYVWLKEPEYVPIVLTKKSSLYQWEAETNKFLHGMEVVTVDGCPYDREKIYSKFFQNHDPNKKRLLIMTYDVLLKDAKESVVRDSDHKAPLVDRKALAKARKILKEAREVEKTESEMFEAWFNSRPYEVWDYAKSIVAVGMEESSRPPVPNNWTEEDGERTQKYGTFLSAARSWKDEADRLDALVHPTMIAPGIFGWMKIFMASHPNVKFMLVMDEAHVVKNHRGKIHAIAAELAKNCERVYGLTATPVKNRLMEFFSLFRIVVPSLFPKVNQFQSDFCVTKLQRISGNRQVPIVIGYRNLSRFVEIIEPFYLSRRKYDVAAELPRLVTRELQCELTDLQEELYDMAEAGLLEKDSDPDASSAAVLGAMTYVQEAVNSPCLLRNDDGEPWEGSSPKIDALLELLEDELDGVKTIVFSRFERMVSLTERALKEKKIKCVRITGEENKASDREKAKTTFQDPNSGVNVILITEAGSESINLQAAEHFVLLDSPWSWGTYLQLIGRMIRIGSRHMMTVATHLVAVRRDGRKTIDHYVIKKLKTKKTLADKVAGEGLKDGLKFVKDDPMELVSMLKEDQKGISKGRKGVKAAKPGPDAPSPKKTLSRVKKDIPVAVKDIDLSEI
jgi:hypothetical protein